MVDKNPAYPAAIKEPREEGFLPEACEVRQIKYLNNIVEQDYRFIKRRVKPGLGFQSFHTVWRALRGYETMHMIRKGQVEEVKKEMLKIRSNSSKICLNLPRKSKKDPIQALL
ncbi:DDE-type integrase/transposase/recombinase [Desulfocicer niacini]